MEFTVFRTLLLKLVNLLPNDPIASYLSELVAPTWLRYLNWFIPVTFLAELTKGWVLAIVAYRVFVFCKSKGKDFFSVITGNEEL